MNRRRFLRTTAIAAGLAALPGRLPALAKDGALRIGLTAVVVREYVRSFNDFRDYLTLRTGRAVSFVQRRTYADIMDLLSRGELEAAWICGFPYIQPRDPEFLDLLVAPVYRGAPLYRSLVIVPSESAARVLEDLRGGAFAYSDPDSNSGYLVPRATLAEKGYDPDQFFRFSFFTYSHAETVAAVAERMADGGSVDSYVYNIQKKYEPDLVARTRVIRTSRQFGFPPIVVRRDLAPDVRLRLRDTLTGMAGDPEGSALLARLALDGFAQVAPPLYDSIRKIARQAAAPFTETVADTL